ncbi:MAG: hypothetical protein ABSD08_21765 [Xanthobacteraceae bacterium]|jgi:hypothetical protein
MASKPNPSAERQNRPPSRYWQARVRPHWLEFVLGIGLLVVGAAQVLIYLRQASIMQTQTSISERQLSFQESVSRAWIRVDVTLEDKIIFTEWAGDKFIHIPLNFNLKNFGQVPAVNVRTSTFIEPFGGSDRNPRLDKAQAMACQSARDVADMNSIGGTDLFPLEPKDVKSGTGRGGLYKNGNPGPLSILGCIEYTYANGRHGQTGFRKILGRVENNFVVGIPFVSGQPEVPREPISAELLASGYPKEPARVARIPTNGLIFRDDDEGGNYAK